jgi:putative tryptophan/tyrosine transport system substrate-binding protein
MRRREFIAGLGGAAAWPVVACGQQNKIYRIGVLILGNADAETIRKELPEGLRDSGYVEGKSVSFDFRSAEGRIDILPKLAAELVASKVDVIVAVYTPCALAAQQATREIPIVIVSGDPIGTGLVSSLARPSGNITGISLMAPELHGKCVELLLNILPSARRIAMLGNASDPSPATAAGIGQFAAIQAVAPPFGVELSPVDVRDEGEIERAVTAFGRELNGGLIVTASAAQAVHRKLIITLAARQRLPAVYPFRYMASDGGLIAYGPEIIDQYRRAAEYVDRILKGEKPADLPVQAPTKYELAINLKTAKALDLDVPQSLLARADQVIE